MPINCIILGQPRSGTSMAAGIFANSEYFIGEDLLKPTISNPLGYFEDRKINEINNELIDKMLKWKRLNKLRKLLCPMAHKDKRLYPSAALLRLRIININRDLFEQMKVFTKRQPFLFKDPRFSKTLIFWQPALPNQIKYIVVFRDPIKTAESYITNGKNIYGLNIRPYWPLYSYAVNYTHMINYLGNSKNTIFIHYEQLLTKSRLDELCEFLEVKNCSADHISQNLSRSKGKLSVSHLTPYVIIAKKVYARLCKLAKY